MFQNVSVPVHIVKSLVSLGNCPRSVLLALEKLQTDDEADDVCNILLYCDHGKHLSVAGANLGREALARRPIGRYSHFFLPVVKHLCGANHDRRACPISGCNQGCWDLRHSMSRAAIDAMCNQFRGF